MLDTLLVIAEGQNNRFPDGNDPFKILTRLLEESGELAQKVNYFEDTGVKLSKYGCKTAPPSKKKFVTCCFARSRLRSIMALFQNLRRIS